LNTKRQKVEQWLPGTRGRDNGEVLLNGHRVSVQDDEKVLEVNNVMVAQQCKLT